MSFISKRVASTILRFLCVFSFLAISIPAFSEDSTYYVRLNSNPYAAPFYIFSTEPDGDSVELSLEKGYSYTFIRTDGAHPFNIGDAWRVANTEIQYSSNGSGSEVDGVGSIVNGEQLTISIPEDFSGDSLTYFCYPHSTMSATFDVTEKTVVPANDISGSEGSTHYVRLNSNPFAAPFYIFSTEPDGDSVELSLEKGYSHTFIRTDDGHAFNIGDAWKVENPEIQYSSNGTGGEVGGVGSIVSGEQLTIAIPEDFTGNTLSYFCYAHGTMIATFDITDSASQPTTQLTSWDFDGNGEADALTDGLLLLRYTFNLRDDSLTNGAIALNSTMTPQQVESLMGSISSIADIDGNGEVDALTDGLLLLRYLFALSDDSLIGGAIGPNATRATAEQIVQYIESLMPESLSDQASGLLVPMADSQEFTALFSQSYQRTFEATSDAIVLESMPDMAMDATASDAGGDSYTSTYTLEKSVDEHDFVKYDGISKKLYIAPSYSMYDDCCFIFEPIALVDDAIEVGEADVVADEPLYPIIPEQRVIKIMSTNPDLAEVTEAGTIPVDHNHTIEGLYTNGDQLASINSSGWWGMYGDMFMNPTSWRGQTTGVSIYDISNAAEPQLDWNIDIEGGFVTSRKIGDIVYLVTRHTPQVTNYIEYPTIEQEEQNDEILNTVSSADILPKISINDAEQTDFLSVSDCFAFNDDHALAPDIYGYPTMTVLIAVDVTNQSIVNSTCYLESTSGVYVSQNAMYLIQQEGWGDNSTSYIHKFNLDSDLSYSGSGKVEGHLTGRGQADFRISEYDGYVRVVTSEWTGDATDSSDHRLTILRQSPNTYSLNQVATLPNSAYPAEIGKPNEALYGVRFFGDKLYLVTFETTDPLYVIDLRNHYIPRVAGELEIPGFSDFLHPVNDELLLGLGQNGTGNVKLELFNIPPLPSADEPVASIEPFSLKEFQVGANLANSWSHSPAQFNRNAFQYQQIDDSTDRFSVPLTISYNSDTSGYVQENQLYLFELQNKDQPEQASFDFVRSISGGSSGWWNNDRQRSFFHNDSVFYINGDDVYSEFWDYPEIQLP